MEHVVLFSCGVDDFCLARKVCVEETHYFQQATLLRQRRASSYVR
jgi:hypothetical protein